MRTRTLHRAWALSMGLVLFGALHFAEARERMAVLIVAQDSGLSDNLTEVAISKLAEAGDRELVGLRELRSRLTDIEFVKNHGIAECLATADCLRQVGDIAGVERAVIGNVTRHDEAYEFNLSLTTTQGGRTEAHVQRSGLSDEGQLIAAVQSGINDLFNENTRSGNSVRPAAISRLPMLPSTAPKSNAAVLPVTGFGRPMDPPHPKYAPYVAYGTAALGALALSVAAVTGANAMGEPTGATRADAQSDLERRRRYAKVTDALLVAGGVMSAVSTVTFVWYWH